MRHGMRGEFLACVRTDVFECMCVHIPARNVTIAGGMDSSVSNAPGVILSFFDYLGDSERERDRIRMPS